MRQRPYENASQADQTGLKFHTKWRAARFNTVFVSAARHKNA
jgi:hypothetical protein